MRRILYALTIAALLSVGVVAQQSGGAFMPSFNYTIPGAWTFTGVATLTSPVLVTPALGAATATSLAATGAIRSSSATAGVGYATGAGCAVTQITNRATGVTCTGLSGAITTDNTSLAAEASAVFVVTDTSVAIGDVVVASIRSGSIALNTDVIVSAVAAGSFSLTVVNGNAAGGTAETGAIIINFAVLKAVGA
jgi:hypothetical protein